MGRRDDKKELKRARIVAAAAALFAQQGYEATTTRQIARRARIAAGTLFLYAPTKADVVMLVFEDRIGRALEDAIAALPDGPMLHKLVHLTGAFFDVYEEDPALARVFVRELLWIDGESREKRRALEARLFSLIAAHVEDEKARGGFGAHVDPWVFATSSFSLYFTALSGWLSGELPQAADARALLARAFELLITGARGTEPRAPTPGGVQ